MIGTTIKEFKLTGLLGKGGMGEVYVGTQQIVNTKVAIKLLRDHISHDRQHVQRFFNEAIAASKIKHAGIVNIFDVGFAGERAFLIMEFLEGESLSARIRRAPRVSLDEIVDIASQLASILEATHAQGITHRDLKPDNVFLVADAELPSKRRAKVLDFGIAKLGQAPTADTAPSSDPAVAPTPGGATALTMTNSSMGTPGYMAPEQWVDAASAGDRADVYSLGCVLFELCCGRAPFLATSLPEACAKHLNEVPPRVRSLSPEIPADLDALVATMLEKKPVDRPSMKDVGQALRGAPRTSLGADRVSSVAMSDTVSTTGEPTKPAAGAATDLAAGPPAKIEGTSGQPARSRKHLAVIAAASALGLGAVATVYVSSRPPARPVSPSPTPLLAAPAGSAAPASLSPSPGCPDGTVRVPATEFLMGTDQGNDWEQPVHRVVISKAFCIDRTEVSVAAYTACVQRGVCEPAPTEINLEVVDPAKWPILSRFCNGAREDRAAHPINCVTWMQADAYCAGARKRLPTEAEWELAARGGDGRRYPWGNDPPSAKRLNLCGGECRRYAKQALGWNFHVAYEDDDGWPTTAPGGSFPDGASPFGALDMAGNVAEWTADRYVTYEAAPVTDPAGPANGETRAARDTSFIDGKIDFARSTNRTSPPPTRRDHTLGFRCAVDATR